MKRFLELFFGEWHWIRRYLKGTWVKDPSFDDLTVTWVRLSQKEIELCGGG